MDSHHFTKYKSPLEVFRSFKFSPFFKESVTQGYKSNTYSTNISKETLCSNEFDGKVCITPNCPYLHFKDIEPSGMFYFFIISRMFYLQILADFKHLYLSNYSWISCNPKSTVLLIKLFLFFYIYLL